MLDLLEGTDVAIKPDRGTVVIHTTPSELAGLTFTSLLGHTYTTSGQSP